MACGPIVTMTTRVIFLPVFCFLYRQLISKISEGSFSDFKTHFVLDGYGGFQDKAHESDECVIDKLDFSIGVKHKKPDPPDSPSGRLFTVSSEDEWRIYQDFMLEDNAKEYELVSEFSRLLV